MNEPPEQCGLFDLKKKKMELYHKQILSENGLSQNDLPKEIEQKILSLTLLVAAYERNPDDETKKMIEHKSADIGHDILDFLEADLEDEPDEVQQPENKVVGRVPIRPIEQPQAPPQQPQQQEKKGGFRLFGLLDL